MRRGDAIAAAVIDNVTNPLGIHRACAAATFSARNQPVGIGAEWGQPQRSDSRLVGNESNYAGYATEIWPAMIEAPLVFGRHAKPYILVPTITPIVGQHLFDVLWPFCQQ